MTALIHGDNPHADTTQVICQDNRGNLAVSRLTLQCFHLRISGHR